jgi:hypothetical protein
MRSYRTFPPVGPSSIDVHNHHSPVDLLVTLADLGRDRPCKQPKGQALFFLVDHGHPEMLSALGAEELGDILEGTMLEAFVGVGLVNAVQIQPFDKTRPILLVREQVRATGRAVHR